MGLQKRQLLRHLVLYELYLGIYFHVYYIVVVCPILINFNKVIRTF